MTKTLLVMAGGTGGHVFPALAVAKKLQEEGWNIHWIGTEDRMEAVLVPKYGIPISFIQISGLKGSGFIKKILAPIRIAKAILQARKIIKKIKPDVALGMGGYVSGPGGIAAKLSGVPLVLHEQNGIAGMTNKWLSKIANKVLQAFPSAFKHADVVGNPVRDDLLTIKNPIDRFNNRESKINVLVMGGSQGAKILNDIVPEVFNQLNDNYAVWHQTGKGNEVDVKSRYLKNCYKVTEFIDDMKEVYEWADLVICRSGALTVSEIEVVGVGAIFVPFMHKDRQQYWNAKSLVDNQAAIVIEQPELTVDSLFMAIEKLDRETLQKMAVKAKELAIYDAAEQVANNIKLLS